MLRLIVGTSRRRATLSTTSHTNSTTTADHDTSDSLEPWVDYIRRATATAEAQLHKSNIEDWPTTYFRRKWRWAGHIARLADDRWTIQSVLWDPVAGARNVGRPRRRWTDALDNYFARCGITECSA